MAILDTLNAHEARLRRGRDDVLGFDPAVRVFLRTAAWMGQGAVVQVQGAPGSGRNEFMRRCVRYVEIDRTALGAEAERLHPVTAWFNPWTYAKHGNLLAGLVAAVCRSGRTPGLSERGRDLVAGLGRLRFDGTVADGHGTALSAGEGDPIDKLRRGFANLVDLVRGEGATGKLLIFVQDLDQLPPEARMSFFDALRLVLGGDPEALVVVGLGREAALAAVRARDPGLSEVGAGRVLDDLFDLVVNVPAIRPPSFEGLLHHFLGARRVRVEAAFGTKAWPNLVEALQRCGPVGPRSLDRLCTRLHVLAEVVHDRGMTAALTPAQWGWLVLAEQWPEFRRFVTGGGAVRWAQLTAAVVAGGRGTHEVENEVEEWFANDPLLAEFLFGYADAFAHEAASLREAEAFLATAGF